MKSTTANSIKRHIMIRIFIFALQLLCASLCLFSFLAYLGGVHPALDLLTIGLPIITLSMIACLPVSKGILRKAAWVFAICNTILIVGFFLPTQKIARPNFTLYQHNLFFHNKAKNIHHIIQKHNPDILTVQELKKGHTSIKKLKAYPHHQVCDFGAIGKVGVISQTKFLQKGCSSGKYRGVAWAQIKTKSGKKVTVASIHLHWPYPYNQAKQIDELIPFFKNLPKPIILAGDFNQVPWSHSTNRLANAIGGKVQNPYYITFQHPPLYLGIDHIIAPIPLEVIKLGRGGSDHHALLGKAVL